MDAGIKDDHDIVSHITAVLSGASSNTSLPWATSTLISQAPQAHMSLSVPSIETHQSPAAPPPAHAHASSVSHKPPDSFLDKGLLEAAALLDSKSLTKTMEPQSSAGDGQSSIPWALQQQLLQQYGQFMEKMIIKQSESGLMAPSTAITDADSLLVSTSSTSPSSLGIKTESAVDPNSIEAQRDVYRRMLNYSMSNTLAQQYYLSQYGYNYMQDRSMFTKSDSGQGTSTTTTSTSAGNQVSGSGDLMSQLPSIDSVLLNLSTKKSNTIGTRHVSSPVTSYHHSIPAYGLQALANAAIEADPKGFHEADTDRRDSHRSELEDVTDTDSSNLSPSDSGTSQIMSPPRNAYSYLLDTNSHMSIPAAHSHQGQSFYQSKSAMGPLPSIQHFSTLGKLPQKTSETHGGSMQLPLSSSLKPSDLVAAAMKLKVEPSEEKEIADRTIQEKIAAHQLNAVQQQVQELAANALAAGNIDAAALLAKIQASNLESEFHRFYDAEALQALQHEPMELTSDVTPGKTSSRRKSRGRPTSIESLRDPLGRQTSTTSSIGGNVCMSGDGEDHTYDCEICGKQFSHNDRLRRHRKIHTSEKPYKCDICGKGFKEKCNLKHHRFIHTGEKPYKCDTCGKSFNQRSSLKTHQKVHTGEKPFKCDLCEKPFAQKYLLRQHMKKHIDLNMAASQQ